LWNCKAILYNLTQLKFSANTPHFLHRHQQTLALCPYCGTDKTQKQLMCILEKSLIHRKLSERDSRTRFWGKFWYQSIDLKLLPFRSMFACFYILFSYWIFWFSRLGVASLQRELIWAIIRLSAATFVATYWDTVALYVEINTIRISCLFFSYFLAPCSGGTGLF
jgi:hypothetical protein